MTARRAVAGGAGFAAAFAAVGAFWASGLSRGLDDGIILSATTFTRDHPAWYNLLVVLDEALQPRWTYLLSSAILLGFGWHRRRREVIALISGLLACWGLTNVVKWLAHRDRPVVTDAVFHAPGFSFPSGHASGSAAVASALLLFTWPMLHRPAARAGAVLAAVAFVLITCVDRVFLGVHFPTDVTAGTIFGAGLVTTAWLAVRRPSLTREHSAQEAA